MLVLRPVLRLQAAYALMGQARVSHAQAVTVAEPGIVAPRRPRFHQLDGLRALAIALVVFHHSFTSICIKALTHVGLPRVADLFSHGTQSGVELFFVLSGVVLLRPYLRRTRPLHVGTYLKRRLQRLWPPYAVAWLFAGAVIAVSRIYPTWYSLQVLPPFSLHGWLAQIGIVNLGWTTYSGAWWSLTPEIFFYLVAPLIVFAVLLFKGRGAVAAAAVVGLSVVIGSVVRGVSPTPDVGELFLLYLPCFIIGVMIARFDAPPRLVWVLIPAGLLYCVVAEIEPSLDIHVGFALLYGGLVIAALEGRGRIRRWLSAPISVWLGERSYSLFLVHFSVFYLVDYLASNAIGSRGTVYTLVSRGVGVPLALLTAMLLFTLVERRFARGLVTANAFWPWTAPTDLGAPSAWSQSSVR